MSEPKTPGQVAHAAYERAMVQLWAGSPDMWTQIHPNKRKVFDQVAQAVREQQEAEMLSQESILDYDAALKAISQVRDIGKVLVEWRTIDPDFSEGGYYDCDAIKAIAKILDPDEPAPEESKDGE